MFYGSTDNNAGKGYANYLKVPWLFCAQMNPELLLARFLKFNLNLFITIHFSRISTIHPKFVTSSNENCNVLNKELLRKVFDKKIILLLCTELK